MAPEIDAVFLDTNVVLDHLADRQPFSEFAHRLFALAEAENLKLYVSALTFCNLYYILRKLRGHEQAMFLLTKLALLVQVTEIGERQIRTALAGGFKDFEDAVQYSSAGTMQDIVVLITRNQRDFLGSRLPVQSPDEYLAWRESRAI